MPIRVLVVDDSSFFRRRITEIISTDKDFLVVGQASNGQEAINQALKLHPDIITMDYEMPYLDGISAVREIMKQYPTSILMFSSLTYDGARTTLDALEAGAKDFLPKSFESVSDTATNELISRLRAIAQIPASRSKSATIHQKTQRPIPATPVIEKKSTAAANRALKQVSSKDIVSKDIVSKDIVSKDIVSKESQSKPKSSQGIRSQSKKMSIRPKLCVIGSSTGGPMALQLVLKCLPANTHMPIVIAQHMPAAFTKAFADRLNSLCQVPVYHAENGDRLKPGCVYISPGGMQTIIKDSAMTLSILKGDDRLNYKPCVDVTFASAVKACPGKVLAIVLTGMGADGADGARLLKKSHSEVWIQDEESCVVFGMPQAVMKTGCYDDMMSIERIGQRLAGVASSGST